MGQPKDRVDDMKGNESVDAVNLSYRDALAEIEAIVKKIEDPKVKIEEITVDVKRALLLMQYCKDELRGYRDESNKLFE